MNLKLLGEVFVTLLVIVDPPGMVPVFLALTGALPARQRIRAGTQAVLLALGVIVVFAVAGQTLLDYLHVQLPALQGAGGLLLVLVALQLLTGKTDEPEEQGGTSNVALVPIGTPLLAGPGAIVATGSSDFHGTHKSVRLGAFLTAPEAYEKIVAAASGVPVLG